MDLAPFSADVLRAPPGARFVFVTIVVAVVVHLIPPNSVWLLVRPELPLVVLLYWTIHQPRHAGFVVAFLLGLAMDVADASVLGQHPFAYAVAVYLALSIRLRVLKFQLWQQALHVLAILLVAQAVMAFTNLFLPTIFPGLAYFTSSFTGALCWIPIAFAIDYIQVMTARRNEV
jgi:rod shape-determining protein MreD